MSISAQAITVGTSAVLLASVTDYDAAAKDGRITYEFYNNGSAVVYLGGADTVTTSNGIPLAVGGSRTIDLRLGAVVYGISGSAGQDVRVLEVQ